MPLLRIIGIFTVALLIFITALPFALSHINPAYHLSDETRDPISLPARNFRVISAGHYETRAGCLIFDRFNADEIIIASSVNSKVSDYPLLRADMQNLPSHAIAKLMWQNFGSQKISASQINLKPSRGGYVALPENGLQTYDRLRSVAFLIYDPFGNAAEGIMRTPLKFCGVTFFPASQRSLLSQLLHDWSTPMLWQGSANNAVVGGSSKSIVPFNFALASIYAVSILIWLVLKAAKLARLIGLAHLSTLRGIVYLFLVTLAVSSVHRGIWRAEQFAEVRQTYAGRPLEERIRHNYVRCARFKPDCKADMLPYF